MFDRSPEPRVSLSPRNEHEIDQKLLLFFEWSHAAHALLGFRVEVVAC